MGALLLPSRSRGLFALLYSGLPLVWKMAKQTLFRARERLTRVREQYSTRQRHEGLVPTVSRLDPVILFHPGSSVLAERLAKVLVVARPMGP